MLDNVNIECLLSAGTIIIFINIAYDYYFHLKFITLILALISFNV